LFRFLSPAITTALYLTGVLTGRRAVLLFIAQIIGGLIASALVLGLTPAGSGDVDVVNTSLSDGVTYAQGFLMEMLGTSVLVFSVLMLGE
jgi:aquaporin rerated protein, other eukaryote